MSDALKELRAFGSAILISAVLLLFGAFTVPIAIWLLRGVLHAWWSWWLK